MKKILFVHKKISKEKPLSLDLQWTMLICISTLNMTDMKMTKMESSLITLSSPTSSSPRSNSFLIDYGAQQKFYIGAADEECSIPSRISMPGYIEEVERSYGEWMNIIRTLYESLQLADSKIGVERQRRRSREQNIIKLAKKLSKTDESLLNHKEKVKKVCLNKKRFQPH